jgi:hypothetical protein
MLKKGDIDNDAADDDEVNTSASHKRTTAALCIEEFCLQSQCL